MNKNKQIATMVHNYMVKNLQKRLTVVQICREFGLGRNKLQQVFKEVYQQTVHEYVLHRKLDRASELIQYSDLPLDIIMFRVGFSSEKVFCWRFECRFGVDPLELMQRVRPRHP
jgi:transcriptional regulator GlxA family with amidase domain